MRTFGFFFLGILITALLAGAWIAPSNIPDDKFTLAHALPDDVFLYISQTNNPEHAFLDHYWGELFDTLVESGFPQEALGLLNSLISMENPKLVEELERLKEEAFKLVKAVKWTELGGKEFVFAEKFVPPTNLIKGSSPILIANMVWFFRGTGDGADHNYKGLVAILEALADEVNKAVGNDILMLERADREGFKVTSLDLLARVPNTPSLPLSVALKDDLVILGFREQLFEETLALLNGSSNKPSLADDSRFQTAFNELSPAEDSKTFFNMQALLTPVSAFVNTIIEAQTVSGDVYLNSGTTPEVNRIIASSNEAYRRGDIGMALSETRRAYEIAPTNSIVLYNLACFNALSKNREEALDWLQAAVDGGFYAPSKISSDEDLDSLRQDPKYKAALTRATELGSQSSAKDMAINFSDKGEVLRLRMQVNQAYEQNNYAQGLEFIKQAYAIAPRDSKVLYVMGCLHTLLGHDEEGLDYLEKAIEAGFYCPEHIRNDSDWKRVNKDKRFLAALDLARDKAGALATAEKDRWVNLAQTLLDRVVEAVGTLDYSATVESTSGYSTVAETLAVLTPDAKKRPIYKLFANQPQLTNFDRYIPKEAVSFSLATGIDLRELYAFIKDTFQGAGEQGQMLLDKWEGIQKQLGLDIHRDLIDWLDGDTLEITLAESGDSVTMIKVSDEALAREKMGKLVDFITTQVGDLYKKNRKLAGLAMLGLRTSPVEHAKLEGFQNVHFAMSPQPAVWGVADGYLIFATSGDAVALCLATARGEHPNIRQNSTVMNEAMIPVGPFVEVSYSDKRGLGDEISKGLGVATMVTGMMGSFIPEPKVRPVIAKISGLLSMLTPVVQRIDFYKSSASMTTFDGKMWHNRSITHYFSPEERPGKGL
ncbi:MAG: DUF3352 domain-containing protein [Planctomycetota bacterium]